MLLIATNLRLSVTAVTPLFTAIQKSFEIDSTITALLVMIPLFCFSMGALITPWLNQKFGLRTLLTFSTILLTLANFFRPINKVTLIVATFFIGSAIALLNILVPIMISQITSGSNETTRLTSYYSVAMNLFGAVGTAVAIPLSNIYGWQNTFRSFAIPAGIAVLVSFLPSPFMKLREKVNKVGFVKIILHDRMAQKLTLFMGLQSLIFYSLISWLPTIYQSLGADANTAGVLLSIFQFVGIPAALVLNVIKNKKILMGLLDLGYLVGTLTIIWAGIGWWLSAIILGFTTSLIFSTALNFVATSSRNSTEIANRSALAQSLGYLLAAIGPVILGKIHDLFNSWFIVITVLIILMGITILVGLMIAMDEEAKKKF